MFRFIYDYIITSQDKLVSPYHGSVGRACCELGTLRFRVDVTTHYDTVIVMLFCFLVYENICSSRWEYGRFFRLFIAILYYVYSDIWIPVSEAQRDTLQNLWVGAVFMTL